MTSQRPHLGNRQDGGRDEVSPGNAWKIKICIAVSKNNKQSVLIQCGASTQDVSDWQSAGRLYSYRGRESSCGACELLWNVLCKQEALCFPELNQNC